MLDIHDMNDADRLFIFMIGLQPWAKNKLNQRQVKTLPQAISAAECLQDYTTAPKTNAPRNGQAKNAGERKQNYQAKPDGGGNAPTRSFNQQNNLKNGNKCTGNSQADSSGKKPFSPGPCHLCHGAHFMASYPNKQLLSALVAKGGGMLPKVPSASGQPLCIQPNDHAESEEETEECEGASLGAYQGQFMHSCNAVTLEEDHRQKRKVEPTPNGRAGVGKSPQGNGLMYVDIKINRKPIQAMVDTGTMHNYQASTEVERLGLILEKGVGRVKAINSASQPVAGIAKSVLVKVGFYEGRTNFSVVVMDDFKVILRLKFLRKLRLALCPARIAS
ncbi:hypothetical protein LguiA_034827 [Lonicera macranthoides]